MRKGDRKRILNIVFVFLFLSTALFVGFYSLGRGRSSLPVLAGSSTPTSSMSGFAWSANFGWLSFSDRDCSDPNFRICRDNTTNEPINYSCYPDTSKCTSRGGSCVSWCQVCNNNSKRICLNGALDCQAGGSCVDIDGYGVNLNTCSGRLSGSAWSPFLGHVDFSEVTYASSSNNLVGWAKPQAYNGLTTSSDGWIKMSSGTDWLGVKIDPNTGTSSGWAWGGYDEPYNGVTTGMGWLSFNCTNESSGWCATSTYGVKNNFTITNIDIISTSAPNYLKDADSTPNSGNDNQNNSICKHDPLYSNSLIFKYQMSGSGGCGIADKYVVNIYNDTTGGTLATSSTNYSDSCLSNSAYPCQYQIPKSVLGYNQQYRAEVIVFDPLGNKSPTSTLSFMTYKNKFPDARFAWSPLYPAIGVPVTFSSASTTIFDSSDNPSPCSDASCDYIWTFPGNATTTNPSSFFSSSTVVKFTSAPSIASITLQVIDKRSGNNYYCATSTNSEAFADENLPIWREVK